jgi:hypothetical protein
MCVLRRRRAGRLLLVLLEEAKEDILTIEKALHSRGGCSRRSIAAKNRRRSIENVPLYACRLLEWLLIVALPQLIITTWLVGAAMPAAREICVLFLTGNVCACWCVDKAGMNESKMLVIRDLLTINHVLIGSVSVQRQH